MERRAVVREKLLQVPEVVLAGALVIETARDVPVVRFHRHTLRTDGRAVRESLAERDAGGYGPLTPWWNDAGHAWPGRDDRAIASLASWQRRMRKDQPASWEERFRLARLNDPVVGVSWYEAIAFCRSLAQPLRDGFACRLPNEAECEDAARHAAVHLRMGNEPPDAEHANVDREYGGTVAGGCYRQGQTIHGLCEMTGTVWEWTHSLYQAYPCYPDDSREDADSPSMNAVALRGGG
jgi:formylglycine-generating enzyme required for sulfatase activity